MKILIIDDSSTIRKIIKKALIKFGYKDILEAENGKEAYDLIKTNDDISCLFLDINMPVMNGFELLDKLKQEKLINKLSIILASTEVHKILEEYNLSDLGVDTVIPKPFKREEFNDIVLPILDMVKNKSNKSEFSLSTEINDAILIVDDSLAIRKIIRKQLELLGCIKFYEANNGSEVLEILTLDPSIKCMFLDIDMPNMNGIELIERLEKYKLLKNIQTILMPNKSNDITELIKHYPIFGTLRKPFKQDDFDRIVFSLFKEIGIEIDIDIKTIDETTNILIYDANNGNGKIKIKNEAKIFHIDTWIVGFTLKDNRILSLESLLFNKNDNKDKDKEEGQLLEITKDGKITILALNGKMLTVFIDKIEVHYKHNIEVDINDYLNWNESLDFGKKINYNINFKMADMKKIANTLDLDNLKKDIEAKIKVDDKKIKAKVIKIKESVNIENSIKDSFTNVLEVFERYHKDFLRSKKLNFNFMKNILPLVYEQVSKIDKDFQDVKVKKLKNEFDELLKIQQDLSKKISLPINFNFENIYLKGQSDYNLNFDKVEQLTVLLSLAENEYKDILAQQIELEKSLENENDKDTESYKTKEYHLKEIIEKIAYLKKKITVIKYDMGIVLKAVDNFRKEKIKEFSQEFKAISEEHGKKLIHLLDIKSHSFDAMIWKNARHSKIIQNKFLENGIKGSYSTETYLKHYLKTIKSGTSKSALKEINELNVILKHLKTLKSKNIIILMENENDVLTMKSKLEKTGENYIIQGFTSPDKCLQSKLSSQPDLLIFEYGIRNPIEFITHFKGANKLLDNEINFLILFGKKITTSTLLEAIDAKILDSVVKNYFKGDVAEDKLKTKIEELI